MVRDQLYVEGSPPRVQWERISLIIPSAMVEGLLLLLLVVVLLSRRRGILLTEDEDEEEEVASLEDVVRASRFRVVIVVIDS